MNDDADTPLPLSFAWKRAGSGRADLHVVEFGPLRLSLLVLTLVVVALATTVPWAWLSSPFVVPLGIVVGFIVLLPSYHHVRIDARGIRVWRWSGVIPARPRTQVLSCAICARHQGSTYLEASPRVEIGDIALDVQRARELAAWLESQRAVIAHEVPRGPYR